MEFDKTLLALSLIHIYLRGHRHARHADRAERVDRALQHDGADGRDGKLQPDGHAHAQQTQNFGLPQPPVVLLHAQNFKMLPHIPHAEHAGAQLRDDRRDRRAGHAHAQHADRCLLYTSLSMQAARQEILPGGLC